jgi:hypothetical protein
MLVAVSMIGVLLHILMDLPTSYGTRMLSPFDWHWFAVDWLPIVDLYLLAALVVGIGLAEVSKTSRRRIASIVLMLMAADYGVRAVAHDQAMTLAPRLFGPHLPPPCDPQRTRPAVDYWPRPGAIAATAPGNRASWRSRGPDVRLSPFRWRLIAHLSNAYELQRVNVLDARFQQPKPTAARAFWRRKAVRRTSGRGHRARGGHAHRPRVSRILPLPRRARVVVGSRRAPPPCGGTTCGLSAASLVRRAASRSVQHGDPHRPRRARPRRADRAIAPAAYAGTHKGRACLDSARTCRWPADCRAR